MNDGFKGWKLFAALLIFSGKLLANTPEIYLEEARKLSKEGHYVAAAIHYKKVLKLDETHAVARQEFRDLLLEAKRMDPETEFSEVEWGLLEHAILESR